MSRVLFSLALTAVAFIVVISAASVDNQLQIKLMEVITECNKTHTVSMDVTLTANRTGHFEETPQFKCMMNCIFESLQMGTEKQGYDPVKVAIGLQMIRSGRPDQSKFYDIAMSCSDIQRKANGKCEKAFQYARCVVQKELKTNGPV